MMAIDDVVTRSVPQDHGNAVPAEIGGSIMAVFLAPTRAFEIDFTHPHRGLRGKQICDRAEIAIHRALHARRAANAVRVSTLPEIFISKIEWEKALYRRVTATHHGLGRSVSVQARNRNAGCYFAGRHRVRAIRRRRL